jgi:hypothetical protein
LYRDIRRHPPSLPRGVFARGWGLRGISRRRAAKGSPGSGNYPQPWKSWPFRGENCRGALRRRCKRLKSAVQTAEAKTRQTAGFDQGWYGHRHATCLAFGRASDEHPL